MRKLGVSNSAIGQLKRLPADIQQSALSAIARLQEQAVLDVRMLSTRKAPDLLTYESGDLVFVLRQLRDRLIVLSVFSHHSAAPESR